MQEIYFSDYDRDILDSIAQSLEKIASNTSKLLDVKNIEDKIVDDMVKQLYKESSS